MHRLPTKTKQDGPPPTFLCRNREEVTRALAAIRESMGLSHLDVDDLAGFNEGYTGKLEMLPTPGQGDNRPSGRSAMTWAFDMWLGALKVGVVLVPLEGTDAAPTTLQAPQKVRRITYRIAQTMREMHASGEYTSWRIAAMFGIPREAVIDVILNRTHTIKVHDARKIRRMAG